MYLINHTNSQVQRRVKHCRVTKPFYLQRGLACKSNYLSISIALQKTKTFNMDD